MLHTAPLNRANGTSVALTSRWIAAARAHESTRRDRLFDDPFAAALASAEGLSPASQSSRSRASTALLDTLILRTIRTFGHPYLAIRTRFFDELLLHAVHSAGVRQVVIAAAGMDTRAFRLTWPPGTLLYELDRTEVFTAKDSLLATMSAQATCQRYTLGVDLTHPSWSRALCEAGYDPQAPSVWLIEGLLMYLDSTAVHTLLRTVAELAAPGSWLGADMVNSLFLTSPRLHAWLRVTAAHGAPWRFGTDTPEALFAAHGWEATVTQPGEEGANYKRWPFVVVPRLLPGVPRVFLITARRGRTGRA